MGGMFGSQVNSRPLSPRQKGHARYAAMATIAAICLLQSQIRAEEPAAETLLLKGRYEEATERFAEQASDDPRAAIGLARTRVSVGRRADALATLRSAADKFPKSAAIRAELAVLLLANGEHGESSTHAGTALELDENSIAARWAQAELLRLSGKIEEAQKAYGWFVSFYNRAPRIGDPQDLIYIGRAAAQHARWTRNSNQFRRIVSDVYPAALRRERDFWPAHLESALLFLEKFNERDAAAEITAGLAINSRAAELHAARAAMELDSFDLAAAKVSLDRALAINPELIWAHQLRADWFLADVKPTEAIAALEEARKLNPRDEETLGRLLASYDSLDGRRNGQLSDRSKDLIDEVLARNAHCGDFFLSAGQACERMRRFPQAAEFYRLAQERLPQLISARGRLGLALMRLGDETQARKILEESFAIDPFNVRVKNQLEVLDLLQNYAVLETEHFVIKFDRGQDELLARYASKHLEEHVFPRLTTKLGYTPREKTLIEIFSRSGNTPGHNWFSARMVGLPFIGTVGACAGKMVALSSPTELPEKYNWARVLEHEMVHVINLQQTDFSVPHWFTEGLAVYLEDQPRPREWLELLARRTREDKLFNLDDITLGFVRPNSGDDWTLAYCQSELFIEHLIERFGDDAPAKMLAAFAERKTTGEALSQLFSIEEAGFEASYRAFIDRLIAEAGDAIATPTPSLAELQKQIREQPNNAGVAAKLAQAWLARDDRPQARQWALKAQSLEPRNPLAGYVLAWLELSIGDTDEALTILEKALDRDQPDQNCLSILAALRLGRGAKDEAEGLYELAATKFPHDPEGVKGLTRIHLESGNHEKLARSLAAWSALEPESITLKKKLAEVLIERKDFSAALKVATEAIHHDVRDAVAHALAARGAAGLGDHAKAAEEFQVAIALDAEFPNWHAELARSLIELGRKDDARQSAAELQKRAPDHPDLPELKKALEQ